MPDLVLDDATATRSVDTAPLIELSPAATPRWARVRAALSFRQLSAVYIFIVLFGVFSIWVPHTFLALATWRSLLDGQALTALAAIGLLLPVAAGAFNLAIGAEIGFASILVSWLLVDHGMSVPLAVVLTILMGAIVGGVNALLAGVFKIDSFIATLGVQSVLLACAEWLSKSAQILNLPNGFVSFSTDKIFGITTTVYILLGVAIVVWYLLEKTPLGRRVYATGGNEAAARLAGVRTTAVVVGAFVACGVIAASVGLLLASQLGTGDPTEGPSFLLPAFSAVFLGSTQFRAGRFNVWGTIVAVYVLAVGVTGFQLAGAPVWIPDLFNGLALILAVGLAKFDGRLRTSSALGRLLTRRSPRRGALA
jgi:ribose transport system permease protein